LLLFAAELLGAFGVFPDFGVFEFAADFGQATLLLIEVKDTSAALSSGYPDR
jgi:hypothetical protein